MTSKHQVLCMGNAIVDIIARVDDQFLETHGRVKASMMLVDAETSAALYAAMPPAIERSGGSAGNTAAGIASFGGTVGYIGKIHDDQLGTVFRHDIQAAGVSFDTVAASEGAPTATSMILLTPDSQRTMNTFLGACVELTPDDILAEDAGDADVLYVEGYLWDTPSMKASVLKAFDMAIAAGNKVSLSLSDSFCVDRFRDEFVDLVENKVDILFANEDEIKALYQTDTFEEAVDKLRPHVQIAALTRSEKGSVIVSKDGEITVGAFPATVDDTTGAGDLFAAGFLYGYTNGRSLEDCAKLGGIAAAEVISHLGARPEVNLQSLAAEKLGS
ncbi:MAG: adenosine kinase [Kordiimonadaceae bacterium]|nr:adenosine kinase [Kordiimonadaceae bacterium]